MKIIMGRDTQKLKKFSRWFERWVVKGFGRQCDEFVWSCAVCHAHFVKNVLSDFVDDMIADEKWVLGKASSSSRNKRHEKTGKSVHS